MLGKGDKIISAHLDKAEELWLTVIAEPDPVVKVPVNIRVHKIGDPFPRYSRKEVFLNHVIGSSEVYYVFYYKF